MIKVDTTILSSQEEVLRNLSSQMDGVYTKLSGVNRYLRRSAAISPAILSSISVCMKNVEKLSAKSEAMAGGLKSISALYLDVENKNAGVAGNYEIDKAVTAAGAGSLIGGRAAGSASMDLFGVDKDYKIKTSYSYDADRDKSKIGVGIEGSVSAYAARAELEGSVGLLSGKVSATAATAGVTGSIGATLFEEDNDGKLKFNPSLNAKASAEVSALKVEGSTQLGTDDLNVHASATGKALTAKAEASVSVGASGVSAKAGYSAYVAEGTVSGGINLFGIKINLSATGGVGGTSAEAEARINTGSVSGSLGIGFGLGLKINLDIDWSGLFK